MTNIEVEVEQRLTDESSDDEQHDVTQEESVQDDVKPLQEQVEVELNKPVKQLTKSERERLINEFNSGKDNKYYKVHKLKNGSMRITKRTNPLVEDVEQAHETVNSKINNKLNTKRLTDNQLLLEHIIDLEKRYEVMRMKHKKLKKRYNKLETDLFEDSDDELDVREVSGEPEPEPVLEPVKFAVEDVKRHVETPVEDAVSRQDFRARKHVKPRSWRSVVTSF